LPQQSVVTFTNQSDIDGYIDSVEKQTKQQFLMRFAIPAAQREVAMAQLEAMGVTSAAMFPGLDGTCNYLREARFGINKRLLPFRPSKKKTEINV